MKLTKRQKVRLKNKRFWIAVPWVVFMVICLSPFQILTKVCGYIMSFFELLYLWLDDITEFIAGDILKSGKLLRWIERGDK